MSEVQSLAGSNRYQHKNTSSTLKNKQKALPKQKQVNQIKTIYTSKIKIEDDYSKQELRTDPLLERLELRMMTQPSQGTQPLTPANQERLTDVSRLQPPHKIGDRAIPAK